jgi:hypothetical protein
VLSPNEPLPPDFAFRFPADLRNVVSFTTLKVLEGGDIPTLITRDVNEVKEIEKQELSDMSDKTLQCIINRPVVKKKDENANKSLYDKPTLDISLPHVSCYFLFIFLIHMKIDEHFFHIVRRYQFIVT